MTDKSKTSENVSIEEKLARAYKSLRTGHRSRGLTSYDHDEIVSTTFIKYDDLEPNALDNQRRQRRREIARESKRSVQLGAKNIFRFSSETSDPQESMTTRALLHETVCLLFEELKKAFLEKARPKLTPRAYDLLVKHYRLEQFFELYGAPEPASKEAKKKALQRARKVLAEKLVKALEGRQDLSAEVRDLALRIVTGGRYLEAVDYLEEIMSEAP